MTSELFQSTYFFFAEVQGTVPICFNFQKLCIYSDRIIDLCCCINFSGVLDTIVSMMPVHQQEQQVKNISIQKVGKIERSEKRGQVDRLGNLKKKNIILFYLQSSYILKTFLVRVVNHLLILLIMW